MAGACSGLKVLEISRGMAGSLAGMVLADHGAEVVKVEPPEGDPYASETGFRFWNRGKQRVALDLKDPGARASMLSMARAADVVLVGLRPSVAESMGLEYESLARDNPRLVFATITGFGWNSPYRDEFSIDGLVHARSGSMMTSQSAGFREGPIFVGPRIASYGAAMLCVQGILAALHVRETTGVGQQVNASLLQGTLCYRGIGLVKAARHQEELPGQPAVRDPRGVRPLFNLNECGDGSWMSMAAFSRAFCEKALEVMGLSHILQDPRFEGMPNTFPSDEDRMACLNLLWDTFKTAPRQSWIDRLWAAEVPCEPVLSVDEFREHPQLWANNLAVRVEDPVVGPMVQPGILGNLSETPGEIRPAATEPAQVGVLQELLQRWSAPSGQGQGQANGAGSEAFPRGPLSGIRVLDFTAWVAGPMCTRLLADLGADVIKIESLEGDWFRISSKGSYAVLNRGKRDVSLNLKSPRTTEVLHTLIREADVVVYNFRLGVEDRLGLGYETVRAVNPNVVLCRMTGLGIEGAQAHRPTYEASLSALSGNYVEQGGEGNPPAAFGAADISSGIAAATTIQLALRARDRTGLGQNVEATMIGTMAYVTGDGFPDYKGKTPRPRIDKNQQGISPLYRLYPTSDGWLMLAAVQPKHWRALQGALGRPEIQGEAFPAPGADREQSAMLIRSLEGIFGSGTTAEWEALLHPAGVPCANPVTDMERFLLDDPEMARSQMVVRLPHPRYETLTEPGVPLHFSSTPCRLERAEAVVGQHTEEVLREAGIPQEAIQEMLGQGAIASATPA